MYNLKNTSNADLNLAGFFSFDGRTSLALITLSPAAVVYYIDEAILEGDNIDIDYTLNDQWARTVISYRSLKTFVSNNGLNDYCFDSSDYAGSHLQDAGTLDCNTFIAENLKLAVKAYFEAFRVGQQNVH